MVPWYILLSKYLHLQNYYEARVLPLLMTPFLIIFDAHFISSSCPVEIVESAKIDGAGRFKIFNSIVLPIIGPGLATGPDCFCTGLLERVVSDLPFHHQSRYVQPAVLSFTTC